MNAYKQLKELFENVTPSSDDIVIAQMCRVLVPELLKDFEEVDEQFSNVMDSLNVSYSDMFPDG